MPGRLDIVRVATARSVVEITWAERNDLIERARRVGFVDLARAFESVVARRPVELDAGQRQQLRSVLGGWARQVGSPEELSASVYELYGALFSEFD